MEQTSMTPGEVENMFTTGGQYRFARWGRAIAPVVFGTDDDSLSAIKDAFQTVALLADMKLAEMDPEFGSNFLVFFCSDWDEIAAIPDLGHLIPDLDGVLDRLSAQNANQYRSFMFDEAGAIKLSVLLLRYDDEMASVSVQALATAQMAQTLLCWGRAAFMLKSPIGMIEENNMAIVRPVVAALIRAGYDKTMPDAAEDVTHALRLSARVNQLLKDM